MLKMDIFEKEVLVNNHIKFEKFKVLLFTYFNLDENVKILKLEFLKNEIIATIKGSFLNKILIFSYELIIEAIQISILKTGNELKFENIIFGESIEFISNKKYYYISFKDKEHNVYYENESKINLYLNIYDDIINGTNKIKEKE